MSAVNEKKKYKVHKYKVKSKANKDDKQKIMLHIKTITKYNTKHWNLLKNVAIAHNYVWKYDTGGYYCLSGVDHRAPILIKGIKIDPWSLWFKFA